VQVLLRLTRMTSQRSFPGFQDTGADIVALVRSSVVALGMVVLVAAGCSGKGGGPAIDAGADAILVPDATPADLAVDLAVDQSDDKPALPDGTMADVALDGPTDGPARCGLNQASHYERPGCGANAPAPACGTASMDACLRGYVCTCAGTFEANCDGWVSQPWAYFVPIAAGGMPDGGHSCDPSHLPDGGP
jgi:hypothetical protein